MKCHLTKEESRYYFEIDESESHLQEKLKGIISQVKFWAASIKIKMNGLMGKL